MLTGLLVEFGPAEIADTFAVRPLAMYLGPLLIGHLAAGILAGKLAADIVFYALAIVGYELFKAATARRDDPFAPDVLDELRHRTPYLLMDLGRVSAAYRTLADALPVDAIHYAVKCNSDRRVLAALHAQGCRFEVASFPELAMLMSTGVKPADVLFSNPVKPPGAGIPIPEGLEGIDAFTVLMQHESRPRPSGSARASGPRSMRCSPGHPVPPGRRSGGVVSAVGWDRLVDRYAIATEQVHLAERFSDVAMVNAEYLVRPRLKLLDESRRVVRVQNAPPDARRRPPRLLFHWHAAAPPSRSRVEPVGKYHDRPNWRDIDYRVPRSAAADDLLALLRDEIEPSVVMRRYAGGGSDLLATFGSDDTAGGL
jgi:hypothetical protein